MKYVVTWIERTPRWATVDASSEKEAIEKGKRGDVIEGSQDSDPGTMDERTVRVDPIQSMIKRLSSCTGNKP